jgi:hypothetical protein
MEPYGIDIAGDYMGCQHGLFKVVAALESAARSQQPDLSEQSARKHV